jgi:hypothetical protein
MAQAPVETSVSIPTGGVVGIDIVVVSSPNIADPKTLARTPNSIAADQTPLPKVARQAFTLADPIDAQALVNILRGAMPTGAENSLVVTIAPNSPNDMIQIELLNAILSELQNLVTILNGLPVTAGRALAPQI